MLQLSSCDVTSNLVHGMTHNSGGQIQNCYFSFLTSPSSSQLFSSSSLPASGKGFDATGDFDATTISVDRRSNGCVVTSVHFRMNTWTPKIYADYKHGDLQNAFKVWANGMVRTPYRATILSPQKFGKQNHNMLIKPLYQNFTRMKPMWLQIQ